MNNVFDPLTDEQVRQLCQLVETLDNSSFDFLTLESGELKVTIGKGNPPSAADGIASKQDPPSQTNIAPVEAAPATQTPSSVVSKTAPAQAAKPDTAATDITDGSITVEAPMLGRFYANPEPGAAPFVNVGDRVSKDSTIGLIEVMKVYTSVCAGVEGVVTEICVQNEDYVEYGQILLRIQPDSN